MVVLSVVPLDFFPCFFDLWVEVIVEDVVELVFWAFLAAGAALRSGTATAANRVEVNNFFM